MTKPYSLDLRERVVAAVESGAKVREVAEHFSVSASFVVKLSQAWRRDGRLAPLAQGGDRRSGPVESESVWLLGQIAAQPDMTLEELRAGLAERGKRVAVSSLWRFFDRHGISFKKNGARQRTGTRGCGRGAEAVEGCSSQP